MGLPIILTERQPREGEVVVLQFLDGTVLKQYPLRIEASEYPNNTYEFSLGSATALAAAGTGWRTIQDSSNRYLLEPEYNESLYIIYYGIAPSYARVYRQYPSGVDRGSLVGTRNPGVDPTGYVDGVYSPIRFPNPATETVVVRGQRPAYYGYHPYAEPATQTIRMSFYIYTYTVSNQMDKIAPAKVKEMVHNKQAKLYTPGGRTMMQTPGWLRAPTQTNL